MLPYRLAAFAAASILCSGFAWAQDAGPGAAHAFAVPSGQRASDRWTPEAMKSAVPKALPQVDPATVRAVGRTRAAPGKPGVSKAAEAAGQDARQRRSDDIGKLPLHWSGLLFAETADGRTYSCSAQFISDDVVLTAAQCIQNNETGEYAKNVAFYLGYEDGKYRRKYDATCLWTYNSWVTTELSRYLYDYAMVKVQGTSATGHWGSAWGWEGDYRNAAKTGYLDAVEGGEVIWVDHGPLGVNDGIVELRHGNEGDQTGSAGGAFVAEYGTSENDNNYVISVDSFTYKSNPGASYGPYFDSNMKKLWDVAEGPCGS